MNKLFAIIACTFCQLFLMAGNSFGQAGITLSPSKLYYKFPYGSSGTQKIVVQNPNNKDLEVGISISDWEYDSLGSNTTYDAGKLSNSCANWIRLTDGTYFILKPFERREVEVTLNAPADADPAMPVHTAMLYFTQLNPGSAGESQQGANVKVTVKMGVKIYHTYITEPKKDVEITDFAYKKGTPAVGNTPSVPDMLEMRIDNMSNIWLEGKIKVELLNVASGKKVKMNTVDFYQLPGDKRIVKLPVPDKTKEGKYTATAIVSYGDKDELKVAELDFEIL